MAGNKKRKRTAGGGGGSAKGASAKGNPFEKQYAKAKYPVLEKRTAKQAAGVSGRREGGGEGRGGRGESGGFLKIEF